MQSLFSNWKSLLGLCLIFVLGCGAGALVDRAIEARKIRQLMQNGPEAVTQVVQRRLTHDLSLDQVQQQQLHAILANAAREIRDTRQQIQPEVRAILLDARKKTEAILRPAQQARFQQDLERAQQRLGNRFFSEGEGADDAPPSTNAAPAP